MELVKLNSKTPVESAIIEMAGGGYPAGTPISVESPGNDAARTSRHFHWFIWTGRNIRKPETVEEYLFGAV